MSNYRQSGNQEIGDSDRQSAPTLTDAQWSQLMSAITTTKSSPSTEKLHGKIDEWIIDTGASNHMSGNIKKNSDLVDISSPAGLPNGKTTMATMEGTIRLSDQLILENVLFVPALTCYLLSVSQLLAKQKYIVLFTDKLCTFQDRTSKNLIGAGEQLMGSISSRRFERFKQITQQSQIKLCYGIGVWVTLL